MEPLTAFFIFEGITFHIIGTILIVSGIFLNNFSPNNNLNKLLIRNIKYIKESKQLNRDYSISINDKIYDLEHDNKISYNNKINFLEKELKSEIFFEKMLLSHLILNFQVFLNKNNQRLSHSKNRAYKGLIFFIGGFLLDGIAVVTQIL